MEKITKQELEDIVLHGLASDIFIAERAYTMFKTIGDCSAVIDKTENYQEFFKSTQAAFKDQFLLATARLFDSPSERNKTRCVFGLIEFLSKNTLRLPEIVEKTNLILVMEHVGFDQGVVQTVGKHGNDSNTTRIILNHFELLLGSKENTKLLSKLKDIRDKRLAHNDLTSSLNHDLSETIDPITFKDLFSLVGIAKNFIGVIGWAYMSMVFMHNGEYHLTANAERPKYSLLQLISGLERSDTSR